MSTVLWIAGRLLRGSKQISHVVGAEHSSSLPSSHSPPAFNYIHNDKLTCEIKQLNASPVPPQLSKIKRGPT